MVNTAWPVGPGSNQGSSYKHDALQLRCVGVGVKDVRIPMLCGNENMLVEAAKRGWQ